MILFLLQNSLQFYDYLFFCFDKEFMIKLKEL